MLSSVKSPDTELGLLANGMMSAGSPSLEYPAWVSASRCPPGPAHEDIGTGDVGATGQVETEKGNFAPGYRAQIATRVIGECRVQQVR